MENLLQRALSSEIRSLISERLGHISQHYPRLRAVLRHPYGQPELDGMRQEAAMCTILGLENAAILLITDLLRSAESVQVVNAEAAAEITRLHAERNPELLLLAVDSAIRESLQTSQLPGIDL